MKKLSDIVDKYFQEDPVLSLVAVETVHEFVHSNPGGNWNEMKVRVQSKVEDFKNLIEKASA